MDTITRLPPTSPAAASAPSSRPTPAPAQGRDEAAAPAKDQVSISAEARAKLAAEAATAQPPQDSQPSETRKFIYGALGLDRPTDATSPPPQDGYTYGRLASAALTAATLLALV